MQKKQWKSVIGTSASIKELVCEIGDKFGLANDWLNSVHYKTYSNVLKIRTLSDPFLIATKLMAGRGYKNDLSDIIGILNDSVKDGDVIKKSDIDKAFVSLYDDIKKMVASTEYDLILLDLMLPKISGLDVMHKIRENSNVPIIIISAKDSDLDKTLGLELGADDYITKPFSVTEVLARIKANIRRNVQYAGEHTRILKWKK